MDDGKTRIIGWTGGSPSPMEPRVVNGQIIFHCPAGHRLVVSVALAGRKGKCSKCSVPVQIPTPIGPPEPEPEAEAPSAEETATPASNVQSTVGEDELAGSAAVAAGEEGDWNFISGIGGGSVAQPAAAAAAPPWPAGGSPDAEAERHSMAKLLARMWAERDHGGIVELHLEGGAVILPEEFSARWSVGTHGLFASQAADGTVTLTAVAWETVQRIVVRQLAAVPGDMFE
jgi:hypothetical protein